MIEIRDAVEEDLEDLLRIYNHAIATSVATLDLDLQSLEERKEWFSHYGKQNPLIVAVMDGQVIGYSCLSVFREKPGFSKSLELSVYIDEPFWGLGIGTALMEEILGKAKELEVHAIVSSISAGNEASVRLHEKFGFRKVGHFPEIGFKFDKWLDVVFYQLLLD